MPNGRLSSSVLFVEDINSRSPSPETGKFERLSAPETRLSLFHKISQRLFVKLLRVSFLCNYNHPPKIKKEIIQNFCPACSIIILVLNQFPTSFQGSLAIIQRSILKIILKIGNQHENM